MLKGKYLNRLVGGAAMAGLVAAAISFVSPSGNAANENNNAQDEQQMIQTGLKTAVNSGIVMNIGNRDPDLVGLGSYMVNVSGDCNGCHSVPTTEYAAGGNPYLLPGTMPPFFSGQMKFNASTYLGGNQDFGSFGPGAAGEIISRNLTPDKTGLPFGGHTLSDFMQIMKTGVDLDKAHPSCSSTGQTNCLSFPFNGNVLQVMSWPAYQNLTDRQLTAIYTYVSTIPCLEGGPGEPASRCK